jgi:hypothetical protein
VCMAPARSPTVTLTFRFVTIFIAVRRAGRQVLADLRKLVERHLGDGATDDT